MAPALAVRAEMCPLVHVAVRVRPSNHGTDQLLLIKTGSQVLTTKKVISCTLGSLCSCWIPKWEVIVVPWE